VTWFEEEDEIQDSLNGIKFKIKAAHLREHQSSQAIRDIHSQGAGAVGADRLKIEVIVGDDRKNGVRAKIRRM